MGFASKLNSERLENVLEEKLRLENEGLSWTIIYPTLTSQESDIRPHMRDGTVRWLWLLNQDFQFLPETFSLTVSIFDRFLSLVRAHPKYLQCIGITCYFLAIKTAEEDEDIPALSELIKASGCGCSPTEVMRMERVILTKLDWNLHSATPLDFLQLYYSLLSAVHPSFFAVTSMEEQLQVATAKLEDCVCSFSCTQFKGSLLSLSLLSQELEKLSPRWLIMTISLQNKTQVDCGQLIYCRELLSQTFEKNNGSPMYNQGVISSRPGENSASFMPPTYFQAATESSPSNQDSSSSHTDMHVFREELKRLRSISVGLFGDDGDATSTQSKRHKAERAMPCGLQSRQNSAVCTTDKQTLQAIAL